MDKKKKSNVSRPTFEVKIEITPLNGEFLNSSGPTVFKRRFSAIMAPISILEMAHFQYSKNSFLDSEAMKELNKDGEA